VDSVRRAEERKRENDEHRTREKDDKEEKYDARSLMMAMLAL
jgi:hypothetical protein